MLVELCDVLLSDDWDDGGWLEPIELAPWLALGDDEMLVSLGCELLGAVDGCELLGVADDCALLPLLLCELLALTEALPETPSAASVWPSARPEAEMPCDCWNCFNAALVFGPLTPSTGPAL